MRVLLFLCISLATYLAITHVFALREIVVVGGNIQVQIDQKRFPKSLLFFPSDMLRGEILAENPILSDIRFEKKYPHTLFIVPTLRPATALLVTPARRVFVDGRGIVLSDADTTPVGIPVITAPISGLRIGQQIRDRRLTASLDFVQELESVLRIETITILDDTAIKAHTGNLDIVFTQNEDVPKILATLQTLLTGFRIKGTLPTSIDLRFDKPVITF